MSKLRQMSRLKLAILVILLFVFVTTVFAQNYYVDNLGRVHQTGFFVGGVQITSSAAELNVLDGIPAGLTAAELGVLDGIPATLTAGELGILDGVTTSAAELNVLDGIAAGLTAAELSILDGVTATTAELNVLDGIAVGLTAAELSVLDGIPVGLDSTEVGYLDGVTSPIQAQIDAAGGGYQDKKDLVVAYVSATQVDVDYTGMMIDDFADGVGNFTIDITSSGANGLEASDSEDTSKWYEIYVLHGTSGECGLLNEAGTAIGTYPAGYTDDERYVGSVYNNGSDNFDAFFHRDDLWVRDADVRVLSQASGGGDTPTTYTDIDCSSAIPPTAKMLLIRFASDGNMQLQHNGASGWEDFDNSDTGASQCVWMTCDDSQIIEYKCGTNNDSGYVDVYAWYDMI